MKRPPLGQSLLSLLNSRFFILLLLHTTSPRRVLLQHLFSGFPNTFNSFLFTVSIPFLLITCWSSLNCYLIPTTAIPLPTISLLAGNFFISSTTNTSISSTAQGFSLPLSPPCLPQRIIDSNPFRPYLHLSPLAIMRCETTTPIPLHHDLFQTKLRTLHHTSAFELDFPRYGSTDGPFYSSWFWFVSSSLFQVQTTAWPLLGARHCRPVQTWKKLEAPWLPCPILCRKVSTK